MDSFLLLCADQLDVPIADLRNDNSISTRSPSVNSVLVTPCTWTPLCLTTVLHLGLATPCCSRDLHVDVISFLGWLYVSGQHRFQFVQWFHSSTMSFRAYTYVRVLVHHTVTCFQYVHPWDPLHFITIYFYYRVALGVARPCCSRVLRVDIIQFILFYSPLRAYIYDQTIPVCLFFFRFGHYYWQYRGERPFRASNTYSMACIYWVH